MLFFLALFQDEFQSQAIGGPVPDLVPADHRDQARQVSTNAATCWIKPHIVILGAQHQRMHQMGLVTGREHRWEVGLSASDQECLPHPSTSSMELTRCIPAMSMACRKLVLLYVANDVIQNARKKATDYKQQFGEDGGGEISVTMAPPLCLYSQSHNSPEHSHHKWERETDGKISRWR
jgi:hypothetical protein